MGRVGGVGVVQVARSLRSAGRAGFAALSALSALALAQPLGAQWGVWPADSLLAAGRLAAAESAYYAAARARPQDAVVRAALGRYLAARGATRVGVVLLEEARRFGGDSTAIARALVPLYERLGDYAAIDTLRPRVIPPPAQQRAQWLSGRPPTASFRDSIVLVTYRPSGDGSGFGTVLLRLGRTELPAIIDPRVSGLIVPRPLARGLRQFGGRNSGIAVADALRLGGVTFANVPATVDAPDTKVRIGFDLLAAYTPTFDPRRGMLTLRRTERRASRSAAFDAANGGRIPVLFDGNGVRLLVGNRWQPSSAAMPAMLLATRRWMWDGRLGDVVLLGP